MVAAVGDELGVAVIAHRIAIDHERRDSDEVLGPLVVVGPRRVVRPDGIRAARDHDGRGVVCGLRGCRADRRCGVRRSSSLISWIVASIVSSCWCSCWITMPYTNASRSSGSRRLQIDAVEQVEGARAHARPQMRVASVGSRIGSVGRSRRGCLNASYRSSYVALVGATSASGAQQPQLFVVGDVREVPAQRRHELGHLTPLVGVGDRSEQCEGPLACAVQLAGDVGWARRGECGGHACAMGPYSNGGRRVPSRRHASSRSSAGHRRRATKRSANSPTASSVAVPAPACARAPAAAAKHSCAAAARTGWSSPWRAAPIQSPDVAAVASACPGRSVGVVHEHRGDGAGHTPPRRRHRVDHAQLEPPTRAHGREERPEVVLEVVGGGPAECVAALDPIGEGETAAGVRRDRSGCAARASPRRRARSAPRPGGSRRRWPRGRSVRGPCGWDRSRATRRAGSSASRRGRRRRTGSWRTTPRGPGRARG